MALEKEMGMDNDLLGAVDSEHLLGKRVFFRDGGRESPINEEERGTIRGVVFDPDQNEFFFLIVWDDKEISTENEARIVFCEEPTRNDM